MPVKTTINQINTITDLHFTGQQTLCVDIVVSFVDEKENVILIQAPSSYTLDNETTMKIAGALADGSKSIYTNVKLAVYKELISQGLISGEII